MQYFALYYVVSLVVMTARAGLTTGSVTDAANAGDVHPSITTKINTPVKMAAAPTASTTLTCWPFGCCGGCADAGTLAIDQVKFCATFNTSNIVNFANAAAISNGKFSSQTECGLAFQSIVNACINGNVGGTFTNSTTGAHLSVSICPCVFF